MQFLSHIPLAVHLAAQTTPLAHPGLPQQQPIPPTSQGDSLQTALIAAGGALLGVVLKDLIFKLIADRRAEKATMKAVYSRYADPLSSATVSLMWRLHETLDEPGRGRFLKLVSIPSATNKYSTYGAYKKLSTLYRLSVLLGWIRACRREFSYLKVAESEPLKPVESAIAEFEHALADGPAVEVERLTELCKLWGLAAPDDENQRSSLAVDVETTIDEYMQTANIEELSSLSDEQKVALASCVARVIATSLGLQDVSMAVLQQSWARAMQIIDIKEAWVYRDWQSAIGDLTIREIESSERRFEAISFSEFESMCTAGTDEQRKWISRLSAVFDGIDLSRRDPIRSQAKPACRRVACHGKHHFGTFIERRQHKSFVEVA